MQAKPRRPSATCDDVVGGLKNKKVISSFEFENSISSTRICNEFRFFDPRLTSLIILMLVAGNNDRYWCYTKVRPFRWRRWKTCWTCCVSTTPATVPSTSTLKNNTSGCWLAKRWRDESRVPGSRHCHSFTCLKLLLSFCGIVCNSLSHSLSLSLSLSLSHSLSFSLSPF